MPPGSGGAEPRGFERRRLRGGGAAWARGWSRSRRVRRIGGFQGRPVDATMPPRPGMGDVDLYATLRAALARGSRRPGPWDVRVRVREERAPVHHIVLLDASGSMYAYARIAAARRIVERIAERSYVDRAPVTLIVFQGGGARVAAMASRNYSRILRILDGVRVGGSTPLPHALLEAYRVAKAYREKHRGAETVVHIVSDGRANTPLSRGGSVEQDIRRVCSLLSRVKRLHVYIYDATPPNTLHLYTFNRLIAELLGAELVPAA